MNRLLKIVLWIIGSLTGLATLLLLSIWIYSGNTPEGGTQIAKRVGLLSVASNKDILFEVKTNKIQ